jgi:hypothetical protein
VRCTSEHYATFEYCTERQLKIISSELRERHRQQLRTRSVTAKALADFITQAEKVQKDLTEKRLVLQRIRDRENRSVFKIIDNELPNQLDQSPNTQDHSISQSQSVNETQENSAFGSINFTRLKVLGELK